MTGSPRKLDVARPVLPPVHCAPWCADRGRREDESCSSVGFHVSLRNGELVEMGGGETAPAHITVKVDRDPGEVAHVMLDDAPVDGFRFTQEEADELGQVFRHASWVARQGGSSS